MVACVAVEAPGTANPTDNCIQWRSGVRYRSDGKSIMEIPAYTHPLSQATAGPRPGLPG